MKTGFVSPIEYLFNVVLLAQWAMFLWYTLTPHWSKKTTILCFLPICLIAPVVATIFPSRSIARLLSVPVIMIAAAFLCFRSRPTRTVFCTIIPEMAIIIPIIHAIAAGRRLAEVRVVGNNQRHALAAANGLPVQASDPVDRIVRCFAVGRGKGRRRQQTDDQDHGKYKSEYTFFHTSSSFYQIYLFTDAPSHRYTFSVRSIYSQIYLVKKF